MKPRLPTCAAALLLASCVAHGPEALLRDKEAYEPARLAAVAQVSNPELLWRTMANAKDVLTVRQAAASRLWALDGDAFWKRMERDYAQVNRGPLWDWLCGEAGKAKEKRALRVMVLSLGKICIHLPVPGTEGFASCAERRAIACLTEIPEPEFPLIRIASGDDFTLCSQNFKDDPAAQLAAYFYLSYLSRKKPPLAIPGHPSLAFIKALAPLLATHPMVDEEVEILRTQSTLPQLPNQTPTVPRGLPLARRNLLASAFAPLGPPVIRTADAPLLSNTPPSPTDTAVCAEILRGLHDDRVVAALFAEADRDIDDTRSEHGGLLLWNDKNEVVFEAVAPAVRRHNEVYLPPESLFVKLRDGLAHVHFHAQKYDNGEYAGPGKGDLEFVENNRVNAVVFTFVDRDTLNADAYFPGKIVVDLGCIKRPK